MKEVLPKYRMGGLIAALIWSCLIEPSLPALPDIPEDPAGALRWKESRNETIQECIGKPPQDAISILGQMARQLGTLNYRDCPEKREIQSAVIQRLLSIPGHADYYSKRIKDAQQRFEGLAPDDPEYGYLQAQLLNEQMYGFETLQRMPSPETVRVLGEFLSDPWGLDPDAKPGQFENKEKLGQADHAGYAMRALARLPLETRANATPPEKTQYWNDIDAWKLWYVQVKAGTRTFRFKGDPQNYSLTGPVSEALEPKGGERAAVSKDVPVAPAEAEKKVTGLAVWPLTLAGALLAAAIWSATRRKPDSRSTS